MILFGISNSLYGWMFTINRSMKACHLIPSLSAWKLSYNGGDKMHALTAYNKAIDKCVFI